MKQTPENAITFLCETCNFKCCKQSDYNRHSITSKHKRLTMPNHKTPDDATAYSCECGKTYIHKSSLCKHKNKCSFNNKTERTEMKAENPIVNSTENKERLFLELISKNNDLMEMLHEQSKTILEQNKTINEMIPKMGNTTNTTNNNNQFNLQVFLNEDCKDALNFSDFVETIKVSFADLENQAENGYVKGITKLFIESLQSLGIHNRPIHCTDKKRKTLYIKENDAWDKEGSHDILKNGIQEITRRTYVELGKSKQENPIEYKDGDSEFSLKCVTIQKNLIPAHPREVTINKVVENITQNTGILERM